MLKKPSQEALKEKLKAEYEALDPAHSNVLLEDIYLNLTLMSLDEDDAANLLQTPGLLQKMLLRLLDDEDFEQFLITKLHSMVEEFATPVSCVADTEEKG